jgi:carbon-monoxide dehydrogenase medium subunit
MNGTYGYYRPTSLEQALMLWLENPGARYVAGGTDVMVQLRDRRKRPAALVSLRGIATLRGVQLGSTTRIGAATTVADIAEHQALRELYPALVQAAGRLGSAQVRSVATLGGNLCNASPCADLAPPLVALGASAVLAGTDGTREMPLEQLFAGPGETRLAPGELLEAVLVPKPPADGLSVFLKKGRTHMDLAQVSVAAATEVRGGGFKGLCLVGGAVGPRPLRLHNAETVVEGAILSEQLAQRAGDAAAQEVSPISDVRASAAYRRHLVAVLTRRALRALVQGRS